jgi:hypothetical protein
VILVATKSGARVPKINYKERYLKDRAESFERESKVFREENYFLREIIRSLIGVGSRGVPVMPVPQDLPQTKHDLATDIMLQEIMTGESYDGRVEKAGLVDKERKGNH